MKLTFAMTAALAAAVLAAPLLPAGTTAEARSLDHYNHNILARDVVTQPVAAKRDVEPFGVEDDEDMDAAAAAEELEARSKVGDLAKKLGNLAKDEGKKLLGARDGMTAEKYAEEYDKEHPDQAAQEAEAEGTAVEAAGLEARGKVEDIAKKLGQIAKDKGKKLLGRDGMTAEQYAEEYDKEHPELSAQEAALESDETAASLEARGKLADLAKKLKDAAKKKLLGARDGMTAEQYAQEYDEEHPEQVGQEAALEFGAKAA
ncbi:hypothetical protein PG993_002859 [Apiospora rasikravindrae]|uniref:Uncharacterized protein n=1 Tax=Apiospora rasikravindrae TaxID=990691 RepID=A0ABR1TXW3_9PEZI